MTPLLPAIDALHHILVTYRTAPTDAETWARKMFAGKQVEISGDHRPRSLLGGAS